MVFIALIFVQVAVFAALVFLLKRTLSNQLGSATSHLDQLNQEAEARLADAKKRSDEANVAYEETIQRSKVEGDKIKQQLTEEGLKNKQESLDLARKQSEEIVARAKEAADLMEEEWQQRITDAAKQLSLDAIANVFSDGIRKKVHAEWVDQMIEHGLDGLDKLNLPKDINHADVLTAITLSPDQKKSIAQHLSKKIGKSIDLKENLDDTLILGVRLTIGSIVIDGSLAGKAKEVIQNARAKKRT